MTVAQMGQVMDVLTIAYPQFYRRQSDEERTKALILWTSMFDAEPVELVVAAVKALVATKEDDWPPTIGAVKARIRQITVPVEMTEAEAWALVHRAVRNSLYGSAEQFECLPDMLRRLVGSPNQLREWAMMGSETVESVVASNFQRSYRARAKSQREYDALPGDVKLFMESASQGFKLPEPEVPKTLHQQRQTLMNFTFENEKTKG